MDSIASTIASAGPFPILARAYEYISNVLGCPWSLALLDKSHFSLDTLGVVGILGGDEAVSAMATAHVCENGRRWLGWYNSPGSYQIANRLYLLSKSRFCDNASPGVHTDPVALFELDGLKGPKFRAAHSGTIIEETGHLASLFMKECAALKGKVVEGRRSQAVGVTIAEFPDPTTASKSEAQVCPGRIKACSPVFSSIPVAVSISACIACGAREDWHSFSLVLVGILASGLSCLTVGSGKFMLIHPDPPTGCPRGDGILGSGNEIVLLKGAEGAVNSITRGKFSLNFSHEYQYQFIGWCRVLLNTQFFIQLLLLPKGSTFGQIMFATSLVASWIYISWLSPPDKEGILRDVLFNTVLEPRPVLTKYNLGTRTTAVVFILLVLQLEDPAEVLNELLPNHTKVWEQWKNTIVSRLLRNEELMFGDRDWMLDGFTQKQRSLLETLYSDAQAAYNIYVTTPYCDPPSN